MAKPIHWHYVHGVPFCYFEYKYKHNRFSALQNGQLTEVKKNTTCKRCQKALINDGYKSKAWK